MIRMTLEELTEIVYTRGIIIADGGDGGGALAFELDRLWPGLVWGRGSSFSRWIGVPRESFANALATHWGVAIAPGGDVLRLDDAVQITYRELLTIKHKGDTNGKRDQATRNQKNVCF
jgi:hypothetical protein